MARKKLVWDRILPGKGVSRQETPELEFAAAVCASSALNRILRRARAGPHGARGNRIMQFRCKGRYVANVCEGKLLRYPAWKALTLPD